MAHNTELEVQMTNQLRAAHERGEHPTNAPYEARHTVRACLFQQSNGLWAVWIAFIDPRRHAYEQLKRVTVKGQPTPEEAMHDAQARWFA